ncbi:MAG: outer membrane protein assembly factor BamC [Pseudomonadota bacterium]
MQNRHIALSAILLSLGTGCSSVGPENAIDYAGEQQATRNLVIPPDLIAAPLAPRLAIPDLPTGQPGTTITNPQHSASTHQPHATSTEPVKAQASATALTSPHLNTPHLLLSVTPEQAWTQLLSFWQTQNVDIAEKNEQLGILRTAWTAEPGDTADDIITETFRSILGSLYAADQRSQFLMRLVPINDQQTAISVTHYGTQQKIHYDIDGDIDRTEWIPLASDPQREYALLNQIAAYLKVSPAIQSSQTQEPENDPLNGELAITDSAAKAWPILAHALRQPIFQIQQQDQNAGRFVIQYPMPEKAFMLTPDLTFSIGDTDATNTAAEVYQIILQPTRTGSIIQVRDHQSQIPDNDRSMQLLRQLAGYFQVQH